LPDFLLLFKQNNYTIIFLFFQYSEAGFFEAKAKLIISAKFFPDF